MLTNYHDSLPFFMTKFKWVGEGRAKLDFHKLSEIVIRGKINQVGVRNITQKENTRTNENNIVKNNKSSN